MHLVHACLPSLAEGTSRLMHASTEVASVQASMASFVIVIRTRSMALAAWSYVLVAAVRLL